jgi:hypothetical protein
VARNSNGGVEMGWQPGRDDDPGTGPDPARDRSHPRDPGDPRELSATSPETLAPARDPRLSGFAKDGEWDVRPPSATLAAVLEAVSGSEWCCPGATRDEMFGMLRQAQALESWAAAVKAGVLRSLIRDDDQPLPGGGYHGDLPDGWTKSLTHDAALALSMPAVSADNLMWVAWDLQARLPGTGDLLAAGILTFAKAKVIHEAFLLLSDENAARAEAMILADLPGKTYGQVKRLAEQAAITVDPESATRRREHAERNNARVTMFREDSGAVALSGRDLPTDQALAAHARVCARAQEYKDSGAFPGDTGMDQFRVAAYLDLLNGKTAEARIASGQLDTITRTDDAAATEGGKRDTDEAGKRDTDEAAPEETGDEKQSGPEAPHPSRDDPGDDDPGDDDPGDDDPGDNEPDGDGPDEDGSDDAPGGRPGGDSPGSPSGGWPGQGLPPRLLDLVLPLATLLGLAERPGESHGLGPLDPGLCRELAVAAVGSPWTRLCVTVTDAEGIAIGHGCARPPRDTKAGTPGRAGQPVGTRHGTPTGLVLPAQANLTITAARLTELATAAPPTPPAPPGSPGSPGPAGSADEPRPPGQPSWTLIRVSGPGPSNEFGTWALTLPDGRQLTVVLESMPTYDCDHRHQSHAYQPNDRLRHLVQVRDYTCTFPTCNRHAKESDFEHAVPYDQGGATCACNAGARSRACHQVKQTKGWQVTQPKPGWHQWQTPSGRTYTQPPKRYPT